MFLDIDVVNFKDKDIPFVNIILNANLIRQVQRIDKHVQKIYTDSRNEQAKAHAENQLEFEAPSPVEHLPSCGAVVYMTMPQLGTYYTVTPFEEVRQKLRDLHCVRLVGNERTTEKS